jgi:hypothetical protein
MSESELGRQMKEHGITDPFDLTEFDQWVNDATRKDIRTVAEKHNYEVFGIHFWGTWTKTRGKDLLDANNFSVDLLFKNADEAQVDEIIQRYEKKAVGHEWDKFLRRLTYKTVEDLHKLALAACWWV